MFEQFLRLKLTPNQLSTLVYKLQHSFVGERCEHIPDLTVCGNDFWCVVEVKVDPSLELQNSQQEGYSECFRERDGVLWFITPKAYKHWGVIESLRHSADRQVEHSHWEDLVIAIEQSVDLTDSVMAEIVQFWKETFPAVQMSEPNIATLEQWQPETFVALRKGEALLDEVGKIVDARGTYKISRETSCDEYGFYLKQGDSFLLWIGMWRSATAAFAAGIRDQRAKEWRVVPSNIPDDLYAVGDNWHLRNLPRAAWKNSSAFVTEINRLLDDLGYEPV